ncbi:hypothetical protein [Limisphaera sp. 4302-co]|uniref:hypothetical protein n=1 Tax=Limisphaera sp. 4302-co TaxID=3400417 RepID=UPI003C221632
MISERTIRRAQAGTLILAGVVAGLYWFGYRSLSLRARELDGPVAEAQKRLVAMARTQAQVRSLATPVLLEAAGQMRRAAEQLLQAGQDVARRVVWDDTTQQRLSQEFQLLEFDRQRFLTMADLRARAASAGVTVADAVWVHYPDYDPNLAPPSLHWALLATAQQALLAALHCRVGVISNLTVLPTLTYAGGESGELLWHHFRIQLELAGPAPALERFLRLLPWRPEDGPAGDGAPVEGKTQSFFVDRILMKNVSANPDVTALDVVISAFCPHPQARPEP